MEIECLCYPKIIYFADFTQIISIEKCIAGVLKHDKIEHSIM